MLVTINQDVLWLNEEQVNIDNPEDETTTEEEDFPVISISDIFNSFKNNDCWIFNDTYLICCIDLMNYLILYELVIFKFFFDLLMLNISIENM